MSDVKAQSRQLIERAAHEHKLLGAAIRQYAHTTHDRLWRIDDPSDDTPADLIAQTDVLFVGPNRCAAKSLALPDLFNQLRWGGQVVAVGTRQEDIDSMAGLFGPHSGFRVEQAATPIHAPVMGMRLPGISSSGFALIARKTRLTPPGQDTNRYTYEIELAPAPVPSALETQVVRKTVPSAEAIFSRLSRRLPDTDRDTLIRRANFLAHQALPMFLTREAATLRQLQETLPEALKDRVPRLVDMQLDDSGQAASIDMHWLRPGTGSISHLDFAHEAATIVHAIHESSGIVHLDLRLDNFVISHDGVCLVDFGNALSLGENLENKPLLQILINEVLKNSATRRDLKQLLTGKKINHVAFEQAIANPGIHTDVFYLALQISRSKYTNELADLIKANEPSDASKRLASLADSFLKPRNAKHAQWKTSRDLLRGVKRLHQRYGEHASDHVALAA